jgi:hypothetical protein
MVLKTVIVDLNTFSLLFNYKLNSVSAPNLKPSALPVISKMSFCNFEPCTLRTIPYILVLEMLID